MTAQEVLWTPGPERVQNATLTAYTAWLERTRQLRLSNYEDLWRWSTEEIPAFWSSIDEYFSLGLGAMTSTALASDAMPGAVWFPGVSLNFAERVLANRDPDLTALQHASELRPLRSWSWGRLTEETARIRAGLSALGVGVGDRVAAYLPNIPETVAAFLATASLGAIWSCAAPESEAVAVIDRFARIAPTVLLAVDGYRRGGHEVDRGALVDEIAAGIPSRPHPVSLGYLAGSGWEPGFAAPAGPLSFTPVPFAHPLWILADGEADGTPDPVVHSHGGILLELTKTAALHLNAQRGDNIFWDTTTSQMAWSILIGVLLTEATVVLFDGDPGYPDLNRLWDLASAAEITTFGTSTGYINRCMEAQLAPAQGRDLSRLAAVGASGSPLSSEGFHWINERVAEDIWRFGTAGGADLCTALIGGVPTLPVREGEFQARSLGAAVQVWDPDGRPLTGETGELVLTRPMPSMPVGTWGDAEDSRLRNRHFSTYPGVWQDGNRIEITPAGGAIVHSRSGGTVNRESLAWAAPAGPESDGG